MLKTVLYLAILGLMVHWAQVMGSPAEHRTIQPELYQEQEYEIFKNYPTSGWSYLRPPRSLSQFSWGFFKDEEDEETRMKKRLDTLEKKQQELAELVKKLQQGEPIGDRSNQIENRDDSGSMESVEVNEGQVMADDSGSSKNNSLGSLENLENSDTDVTKNERDDISFSKIESNVENDSVDLTNTLLPVSQNTSSTVITNDPLTKISQDYKKDKTNIGLTNTIMVTESNVVGLMPITNPTERNNFLEGPKESYQIFHQENESTPIFIDNNESSVQDLSGNGESLASSYSNPSSPDSKGYQIKGAQVSHENQDATQDTDDQSVIRFDHASTVVPSDIFAEFLSKHKKEDEIRMEQLMLSKEFEKVHEIIHNFEENKDFFETLSILEKKNKNKKSGPYGFFRSLNKPIESNPLVAEADKIFRTGPPTKECAPCPEINKVEKPTCILTTTQQVEQAGKPQKDKAPSTPGVSSPPASNTQGTTDKKQDEATKKPVIKEPEKTEEKKPEEPPQKINA